LDVATALEPGYEMKHDDYYLVKRFKILRVEINGKMYDRLVKFSCTLASGIDIGPTFINFGFFSRPYSLIREYIKVI
jgi:hypothetical protein